MQLMIDIMQETPEGLRLASKFLSDHATLKEAMENSDAGLVLNTTPAHTPPTVPTGTSLPPVAPVAPPAPPAPLAMPSNVVPLVPPAPHVATPIAPAAPPAPSAAPAASILSAPASTATTTAGTLPTDDYDSAGMPWDARIHQKAKSKKKDLTWKLQKGIDQALVASVCQELSVQGRMRSAAPTVPSVEPNPTQIFGQSPVPVGASAPVPLPPQAYQAGQLPPPPPGNYAPQTQDQNQGQENGIAPPPPPPPQASVTLPSGSPVHVPPAPTVGMPNGAEPGVLPTITGFRALVDKITKAKAAGKLTPEQVSAAIQQAGAPSLQMLGSMSHLVPVVDAIIDATLAMG